MEHNKELAKIAYAAFILASSLPAVTVADIGIESKETYLAHKGCGHHGCGATADMDSGKSDVYNTRSQSYQMSDRAMTPMTEEKLLIMLNPETKTIYMSLDSEGKTMARQLASQDSYQDKNLAVKEAKKQMDERRTMNR